MRDMIVELWIQTWNATTFRYTILFVLTHVTRKLQVVCWRCRYQMTALLLEMCIFCARGGCKILMTRYASKGASQSLSNKPFLRTLRHKAWKLQVIYGHSAYRTTPLLWDTFFVWFRFALEIQLESYSPRHAHCLIWHCVCLLQVLIYIGIWYATIPDNKSHVPYECLLHASFYKNKVG